MKFNFFCSLDEDIWQVRIHFDAREPLEMKLCGSDITYLNLVAVMETQGFNAYDCLFHIENPSLGEKGLDLVDSHAELQMIKRKIQDKLVLNLLVRACPPPDTDFERHHCERPELSTVVYQEPVVYDLSEPPILAVDQEGVVFESQCSTHHPVAPAGVCTQESRNATNKLKAVLEEEEEGYQGFEAYEDSDSSDEDGQIGSDPNYMVDEEDVEVEEGKRQRELEVQEEESDDDQSEEEEMLHYEGDTEVEDPFEVEEDRTFEQEEETIVEPVKKKQKLPVRRGPTTRSHCSELPEVEPDFRPSSDEEEEGLLRESDDDGFQPLSFVLQKKRKSRAKKRPARKWYNEKMEQPHEQLCMKLCFRDQHQFREALLNLHITQARNFRYHRNSDQRIIVECTDKQCQFFMVAAVIKGEKTFVIKKMRLEHTCPSTTETTRVSAKWLAQKYEHLFRSDITTGIQTIIDACMEKYGVDVPKCMAYRAKNIAIEAVLGDHKKQYPRLKDYAQTVMDTNPGSRVIVTTVTPVPNAKIPHPGPRFHAMFFCLNGAREGFLNGCRPFIG